MEIEFRKRNSDGLIVAVTASETPNVRFDLHGRTGVLVNIQRVPRGFFAQSVLALPHEYAELKSCIEKVQGDIVVTSLNSENKSIVSGRPYPRVPQKAHIRAQEAIDTHVEPPVNHRELLAAHEQQRAAGQIARTYSSTNLHAAGMHVSGINTIAVHMEETAAAQATSRTNGVGVITTTKAVVTPEFQRLLDEIAQRGQAGSGAQSQHAEVTSAKKSHGGPTP